MVRIVVEVEIDSRRLLVRVCAGSIQKALECVEDRYGIEKEYKVVFPLDPEWFFAAGSITESKLEELGTSEVGANEQVLS